jgi:hypothetical protein
MDQKKQRRNKSTYKAITICSLGCIILSELATRLLILAEIYSALIHILIFPVFVICLFLWLNASEKERDIPFVGY